MAAVERRRRVFNLGFSGSPFVLAQALLLTVGIGHRSLTDLIELLAPGWFLVGVTVFEIILDGADKRVVVALIGVLHLDSVSIQGSGIRASNGGAYESLIIKREQERARPGRRS